LLYHGLYFWLTWNTRWHETGTKVEAMSIITNYKCLVESMLHICIAYLYIYTWGRYARPFFRYTGRHGARDFFHARIRVDTAKGNPFKGIWTSLFFSRQVFAIRFFLSAFRSSSQNYLFDSPQTKTESLWNLINLPISFLLNYRYFSFGITIVTQYRCWEWSDIQVIYTSGQLSKQIIQLIDYSDVSSGPDSIQAPDESGMTTGNNWLAK